MAYTNDAELKKALQHPIQISVDLMMSELRKGNKEKIIDTVYMGYYPAWYERTLDFENAWTYEEDRDVGNIAGATFDYHPELVDSGTQEDGQHASIVDGTPFTEPLADAIYQGYDMPRNGVHIPARNAFNKTDRWFSELKVCKLFASGLKKAGVKIAKQGGATKKNI